jgi:hypothetical protein
MRADGGTIGGPGFANANPLIHLNHIADNEFGAHSLTEAPSASQGSPLRIHDHMRLTWTLPHRWGYPYGLGLANARFLGK